MPVTRRQLHSDLAKVSRESSSEHSKFSTRNPPIMSHGNIFLPYKTEKLVAGLNKINLDKHPTPNKLVNLPQESVDDLAGRLDNITLNSKLDLSEHPTNQRIFNLNSLPERHVFNNFAAFCHAVANTLDGPKILHLLIKFMKYDVRMAGQYTK